MALVKWPVSVDAKVIEKRQLTEADGWYRGKGMARYTFAVVTHVAPFPDNHAMLDDDIWIDGRFRPDGQAARLTDLFEDPLHGRLWGALRGPVFSIGEILILGPGGREVGFPFRKPSKWHVTITEYSTLEAAIACANAGQRCGGHAP